MLVTPAHLGCLDERHPESDHAGKYHREITPWESGQPSRAKCVRQYKESRVSRSAT